jgi:osmotically-inducible protein OsmY
MKHILEQYKDNQITEQVKEKLEKADNFKSLLQVHSQIKKINKDWEIGIKIKKQ